MAVSIGDQIALIFWNFFIKEGGLVRDEKTV
jgi:hypothetical protein